VNKIFSKKFKLYSKNFKLKKEKKPSLYPLATALNLCLFLLRSACLASAAAAKSPRSPQKELKQTILQLVKLVRHQNLLDFDVIRLTSSRRAFRMTVICRNRGGPQGKQPDGDLNIDNGDFLN